MCRHLPQFLKKRNFMKKENCGLHVGNERWAFTWWMRRPKLACCTKVWASIQICLSFLFLSEAATEMFGGFREKKRGEMNAARGERASLRASSETKVPNNDVNIWHGRNPRTLAKFNGASSGGWGMFTYWKPTNKNITVTCTALLRPSETFKKITTFHWHST